MHTFVPNLLNSVLLISHHITSGNFWMKNIFLGFQSSRRELFRNKYVSQNLAIHVWRFHSHALHLHNKIFGMQITLRADKQNGPRFLRHLRLLGHIQRLCFSAKWFTRMISQKLELNRQRSTHRKSLKNLLQFSGMQVNFGFGFSSNENSLLEFCTFASSRHSLVFSDDLDVLVFGKAPLDIVAPRLSIASAL